MVHTVTREPSRSNHDTPRMKNPAAIPRQCSPLRERALVLLSANGGALFPGALGWSDLWHRIPRHHVTRFFGNTDHAAANKHSTVGNLECRGLKVALEASRSRQYDFAPRAKVALDPTLDLHGR